jgi:DNA-binding NarL/FixJ family response regulator
LGGGSRAAATVGVVVVRNGSPLFSDVLARALGSDPAVSLLAPPAEVEAAPRACRDHHPDVVVVEATQAPAAALGDLVRPIRRACDGAPVVLVADEVIDDAFLVAGLEAGAAGIVDASAGIEEVVDAVRAAAEGKRLVDPARLAAAVEVAAREREQQRRQSELFGLLSDREREVLAFLTRGMRNSEIAAGLSISPRTVEKHVHHILAKLEVPSRLAAVALAAEMGYTATRDLSGTP